MANSYNLKSRAIIISSQEILSRVMKIMAFSVLMIISAKIEIPTQPVPFTLQTLFVLLSGALLGRKDGAISQIFYLAIGIIGIPVFAGPIAGLTKILGPTGGYLISFPIAAFIVGWIFEKSPNLFIKLIALFAGLSIIFFTGIFFLNIFYIHDFSASFKYGAAIFTFWEVVKVIAALSIYKLFKK